MIHLNILNFCCNSKWVLKFFETLSKILRSKFIISLDGKYLMDNGMKEGVLLGQVLKKIEKEWIDNKFKISNDRINEIIKLNS